VSDVALPVTLNFCLTRFWHVNGSVVHGSSGPDLKNDNLLGNPFYSRWFGRTETLKTFTKTSTLAKEANESIVKCAIPRILAPGVHYLVFTKGTKSSFPPSEEKCRVVSGRQTPCSSAALWKVPSGFTQEQGKHLCALQNSYLMPIRGPNRIGAQTQKLCFFLRPLPDYSEDFALCLPKAQRMSPPR